MPYLALSNIFVVMQVPLRASNAIYHKHVMLLHNMFVVSSVISRLKDVKHIAMHVVQRKHFFYVVLRFQHRLITWQNHLFRCLFQCLYTVLSGPHIKIMIQKRMN